LKTFPTSFLKQLKTINYFGVDKNLIFIIGGISMDLFLILGIVALAIMFSVRVYGLVRYYFLQKLLRNLLYNNVDILVKQRRFL